MKFDNPGKPRKPICQIGKAIRLIAVRYGLPDMNGQFH
jgi:hypothetical protein